MFPRELLSVRRRGDEVRPAFAPVDEEHLRLARDLVEVFERHVGRTRGELMAAVEAHELELGPRYKLARGLAILLERRSAFELATKVDPPTARRIVFEASATLCDGAATTDEMRAEVLAEASRRLATDVDEVQRAMGADQDDALVLVMFEPTNPEWLLRRYNLGLAQTLLFDATRMQVSLSKNFRGFLSLVKLHGLMHVVMRDEDGTHHVALDGPVSLFRDTRRYGTAMAKVVPGLARCGDWTLEADVRLQHEDGTRTFRASSATLPMPRVGDHDDDMAYDSGTERRFAQGWRALKGEWRLVREPAALPVGGGELFFPDFGFAWRDGPVKAHLEVVGFWTPEYLKRKLEKLRALKRDVPLLLAVDRALGVGAEDFEDAPADVLFYKNEVPLVPIVQWLKAHEAALVDREAARVVEAGLNADAPVVTLHALADAHGVSHAAVEQALADLDLDGRERVGDALVRPDVLDAVAAKLAPGTAMPDVEALARGHGITDTSSLLARLGYTVAWQGLDPSSAVIRRRDDNT